MHSSSGKDISGAQSKERRKFSRRVHCGSVFFATQKQLFEGELLNYSPAGIGIRFFNKFSEGDNLIVALPFEDATAAKCQARVVWCNGRAFGLKLVR
jgi:hypothetical protein